MLTSRVRAYVLLGEINVISVSRLVVSNKRKSRNFQKVQRSEYILREYHWTLENKQWRTRRAELRLLGQEVEAAAIKTQNAVAQFSGITFSWFGLCGRFYLVCSVAICELALVYQLISILQNYRIIMTDIFYCIHVKTVCIRRSVLNKLMIDFYVVICDFSIRHWRPKNPQYSKMKGKPS